MSRFENHAIFTDTNSVPVRLLSVLKSQVDPSPGTPVSLLTNSPAGELSGDTTVTVYHSSLVVPYWSTTPCFVG